MGSAVKGRKNIEISKRNHQTETRGIICRCSRKRRRKNGKTEAGKCLNRVRKLGKSDNVKRKKKKILTPLHARVECPKHKVRTVSANESARIRSVQ